MIKINLEENRKAATLKKELEYITKKASDLKESFGNAGKISKEEFHTLLPNK